MERFAVIGTAPNWTMTPWQDSGLHIASLNDAYQLKGFQRADEWYDLHPLDKFHVVARPPGGGQVKLFAHEIPFGHYVRPVDHYDWLATQTIPVWLHPEYQTQHPGSASWPMARAFPKADIEAHFGQYFTSTPAWILAHALMRGAREIHIYGINLATESEYRLQRSQFEFMCGAVLGAGKRRISVEKGLRRYETEDGVIVIPESSPILSASHQYAFEPSPERKLDPLKWECHKAQVKLHRRIEALKQSVWWMPYITMQEPAGDKIVARRVTSSTLRQEIRQYELLLHDCQEQMARLQYQEMR